MHAQTLAAMEEQNQHHRKATRECNADIAKYKEYVEGMFNKINAVCEVHKIKLAEHDNAIQIGINDMLNLLSTKVSELDEKVKALDVSFQSLKQFVGTMLTPISKPGLSTRVHKMLRLLLQPIHLPGLRPTLGWLETHSLRMQT